MESTTFSHPTEMKRTGEVFVTIITRKNTGNRRPLILPEAAAGGWWWWWWWCSRVVLPDAWPSNFVVKRAVTYLRAVSSQINSR